MSYRRTQAQLAIAAALVASPTRRHWGYELSREAGVGAGSMYPFLRKLLDEGYLSDGWEDPAEAGGRPPRRYYVTTDAGMTYLRQFLDAAPSARPAPAGNGRRGWAVT